MPPTQQDRDQSEERRLLERIFTGDDAAVEFLLFHHCAGTIRYLARQYFRSFDYTAEDLTTDLYFHLHDRGWRVLRTWQGKSSLKTWLQTVISNLCLQKLKDLKRFEHHEELEDSLLPPVEPSDMSAESVKFELIAAMEALSPRERLFLVQHVLHDRNIQEVADDMRISRRNADVLKHRAKEHLREEFRKRGLL